MNFDKVDIISFNDELRNTFAVRDKKDIDVYKTAQIIDGKDGQTFDEIASRNEIFGRGSEDLAFQIFEANVADLVDLNLDEGKLKKIIIPLIEET